MNKTIHPTNDQSAALQKIWDFLDDETLKVFILKGYAGTGKTTMMKLFISRLNEEGRQFCLLASTGRAAKILSDISGQEARTIHSHIYSFSGFNQDLDKLAQTDTAETVEPLFLQFGLKLFDEENAASVYIVDEASMISDKAEFGSVQAKFGSGNLVQDLLDYDKNAKLIFVGDECQLPPVNDSFSPALTKEYLETQYHLGVSEAALTEIVRQKKGNDIVDAASKIRSLYHKPPVVTWGRFPLRGYNNIEVVPNQAVLLNKYVSMIKAGGYSCATLIAGSNKTCNALAELLRPALGYTGHSLQVGELLLVTQNNLLSGLMNGDLVKVTQVGMREERAGLTFLHVEVENTLNGKRYSQLLIEDILYSSSQINISQEQQRALYVDYAIRMQKQGFKSAHPQFRNSMFDDPYLNALRAVYGYALTCHKSQGGEWKSVFLDIPRYYAREPKASTYQWLYTAMTRTTDKLYIVDDFFVTNG